MEKTEREEEGRFLFAFVICLLWMDLEFVSGRRSNIIPETVDVQGAHSHMSVAFEFFTRFGVLPGWLMTLSDEQSNSQSFSANGLLPSPHLITAGSKKLHNETFNQMEPIASKFNG